MNEPEHANSRQWVAVGIVLALCVSAVVSYALTRKKLPEDPQRAATVYKGYACGPLEKARLAFVSGDDEAFAASLEDATEAADHALNTENYPFGVPERIALQLQASTSDETGEPTERTGSMLDRAQEACSS